MSVEIETLDLHNSNYGYFSDNPLNGIKDPQQAGVGIKSPEVARIATNLAQEVLSIERDEQNILPLKPETKVLLVEQVHVLHEMANSKYCYPPVLWQKMLARSENVGCVEVKMAYTEDDIKRIMARLDQADVIVITNYYGRREGKGKGNDFVAQLVKMTDQPVIVVTNSPFPFTVKPEYKTVIVNYGVSPECLNEAAAALYGERN